MFPAPAPASRREVELLGEWLNSVLAENLEQNDNPLDVCTNAQHWFSVAFNELVRQVSVDCAERGRLFAVIWKRNQDLLTKLVQVQKEERQYILACHKERMQFLRTDLDFCQSRLDTIQTAYNEEEARWISSHERDVSKFGSLQQKIDEQIQVRKELIKELNELKQKLGMELVDESTEDDIADRAHSYTYDELVARAQELRWNMRLGKTELLDMANEMDDITHYLDMKQKELKHLLKERAVKAYEVKEAEFPESEQLREIERVVLLKVIDARWMDHIDDMDQLRQGIGLQAYGQRDPLVEYKMTGYNMFGEMTNMIAETTLRMLFNIRVEQKVEREEVAKVPGTNKDDSAVRAPKKREQKKIYPNDPCPCGSGKKYKQCCGRKQVG